MGPLRFGIGDTPDAVSAQRRPLRAGKDDAAARPWARGMLRDPKFPDLPCARNRAWPGAALPRAHPLLKQQRRPGRRWHRRTLQPRRESPKSARPCRIIVANFQLFLIVRHGVGKLSLEAVWLPRLHGPANARAPELAFKYRAIPTH